MAETVKDTQSVRRILKALEESGELLRVPHPVELEHELAAYLSVLDGGPVVLFEDIAGRDMGAFGNLLNSRERLAHVLGTDIGGLHQVLADAVDQRRTPIVVDGAERSRKHTKSGEWRDLPVPKFFSGETGSYVTAGVIVAKGRSRKRNVSFARLKILDGSHALIGIAPTHHLAALAREAASHGESLEVAVTIGNHPAVLVAAAYYLDLGDDEFEVAGALLGEPLELVRCETVDLEVPAAAEIVVEGVLDPAAVVEEGMVSEFSGLYQQYEPASVVTTRCITVRDGPMFQVILPGYSAEHVLIGAVAIAAGLERRLRRLVPSVAEVAVTPGGCGRLHAVISLHDPQDEDAAVVMREALSAVRLVKLVTVVDDDIDVHDATSVEWAFATRMKADRDLLVLPDMRSARADPLAVDSRVAKLGINATRRSADRSSWEHATPPEGVLRQVKEALRKMDPGSSNRLLRGRRQYLPSRAVPGDVAEDPRP